MKIGFEGLAPHNQVVNVPDGYDGLDWTGVGAIDRGWLRHHRVVPDSGYYSALSGKDVAYGEGQGTENGTIYQSQIFSGGSFSLASGVFASIGPPHETVVFQAYRHDHLVGTQEFQIDAHGETLHLNHHFHNVDKVVISTDPELGGSGGDFVFDNLNVTIVDAGPSAIDAMHAHDALMHGADAFAGMLA